MDKRILVVGGTGKTGRRVANRLQDLQIPVRIASRQQTPAFDWEQPENWPEVLTGIEKVYLTFQPDLAVPGAVAQITRFTQAARAANIKKIVLLSGRGEKEAQACEQVVIDSGMDWTIVRASWFMQNFSENFLLDGILSGDVVLPVIDTLEPFVDVDDIADVVVEALTDPRHSGRIYELTGPELLSFEKAVALIATALNRKVHFTEISMDEYVGALRSYELPEDFIWLIQYLFTEVLDGRNAHLSQDLEKLLNRPPTSFAQYVSKTLQSGVWDVPEA